MILNIGDTIACKVQNPSPAILKATLNTWESVVLGRELVSKGSWYKLTKQTQTLSLNKRD